MSRIGIGIFGVILFVLIAVLLDWHLYVFDREQFYITKWQKYVLNLNWQGWIIRNARMKAMGATAIGPYLLQENIMVSAIPQMQQLMPNVTVRYFLIIKAKVITNRKDQNRIKLSTVR